ncbi:MAG TPA: class I SAM-dependent methyltransferase [Candidatus Acidoferrum sp.]|nr:class I SAM-dependent methyltransferase [Candidatus Acidoferrum sp.]
MLILRRPGADSQAGPFRLLRHPLFAWLGIRPVAGQHTLDEHKALKKWAAGKSSLVEIGVAEGASAVALREAMSPQGMLSLVDPFHLSRLQSLNAMKRAARKVVESCQNGRVIWIEKLSTVASKDWNQPIDFLFIDGDHSERGVQQDWDEWHRFVVPGGVVIFHDAAIFPGGWTERNWGPVKLVDRLFRDAALPGWRIVEQIDSLVVVERIPEPRSS